MDETSSEFDDADHEEAGGHLFLAAEAVMMARGRRSRKQATEYLTELTSILARAPVLAAKTTIALGFRCASAELNFLRDQGKSVSGFGDTSLTGDPTADRVVSLAMRVALGRIAAGEDPDAKRELNDVYKQILESPDLVLVSAPAIALRIVAVRNYPVHG
ncbi:hypothetical protein [Microcella sp.]|uniref:hypothetical protein n=1 Tax=Microcella sp. TaxID=1913979 RepID=UPI0025606049|nr:hypothetical protein [Microcella sp.]MBX9470368.1 hypothetical protein [Microcella sp.]